MIREIKEKVEEGEGEEAEEEEGERAEEEQERKIGGGKRGAGAGMGFF